MCKCGSPNAPSKRYCSVCHAAYMRRWRVTHRLTPEQRVKDSARSYAAVAQKRGHLVPKPCEVCQAKVVERHQDDYSKPLQVRWFCRPCHLEHHRKHARNSVVAEVTGR